MYLTHFGLNAQPFSTTPDPRFFYPSAKHREALACLMYAVEQRKGFALVTGEVGAGKSMLCRAALERFGETVEVAVIVHSRLSPKQFFQAVCAGFNVPYSSGSKFELIQRIKKYLEEKQAAGKVCVLLIDESQNLGAQVLEEVRLLGNLETSTAKLLQIIMVGQPEMRAIIGSHALRQLNQRIAVKFHLGALSADDVSQYIQHRMTVAGGADPDIFDADARREIAIASGGVPRMINVICDQALLQAFVSDERTVTADGVKRVIAEMEGYYMDAAAPARNGVSAIH